MGQYKLFCPGCKIYFDDNFSNQCPRCGKDGPLIKTDYSTKDFSILPLPGLWKFLNWLPCFDFNDKIRSEPVIYKSSGLANELGLKNLYIAFNGYWPEKNANILTCTFKELEAPPTYQRAEEKCINNLIIASAGNTARAFIFSAQYFKIELYVVIPRYCLQRIYLPVEVPDNVTIIAVNHDSDYTDSILFAGRISKEINIVPEGGARNVARRDGMGTVILEGVNHLNRMPDHYFQAVGSGTGAIATLEMAERLLSTGKFGDKLPKLHLSQNEPFTPLTDAWDASSNELIESSEKVQRAAIEKVYAKVLTNRHPPYSIPGGVFDVLTRSKGEMYGVTNREAISVAKFFEASEGIDMVPAASVAAGALVRAIDEGTIDSEDVILLNITGGGEKRLWENFAPIKVEADIVISDTVDNSELKSTMEELHERRNK